MGQSLEQQIAVIIPALNESENLKWLLPNLCPRYRVIVVDNGSDDGTAQVAKSLGARVLSESRRGYGIAVQKGMKDLQGADAAGETPPKAVVVFDADGTSPWEDIGRVSKLVLDGHADLVIGQRMNRDPGAMPTHARFGNWLAVTFIQMFAGYRFLEMGSLRAIGWRALLQLEMEDPTWGWNVEMQVKSAMRGLRIIEIPIEYRCRVHGLSKISGSLVGSLRAGAKIIYAIVKYSWTEWRRRLLKPQASSPDP